MRRMLAATGTKFLKLQTLRRRLTVLGRRIIPLFTIRTLQLTNFAWHLKAPNSLLKISASQINPIPPGFLFFPVSSSIEPRNNQTPNRIHDNRSRNTPTTITVPQVALSIPQAIPALRKFLIDRLDSYLIISEIVPAPTVCPPSRMANRRPLSIATGVISSISNATLSPGITISVPAGNSATPVTSVVRK